MFSFLKNHPFAVEAFFKSSLVLTFAVPKEKLEYLIPPCLKLDTFNDKWAFIAVAMVQTIGLRPKGFPKFFGNDFFLIGYRIFVKYTNTTGKKLRGLLILKTETDKKSMEFLGNVFTHYNYTMTDIIQAEKNNQTEIKSIRSGFHIQIEIGSENVSLPENSPFSNWEEARKFAGPLPFTFTYNPKTKNVLIVEGVRQNWRPRPAKVITYDIPPVASINLKDETLANSFVINNIPYYWKKGKKELWNG
jgi:hypothetical protein